MEVNHLAKQVALITRTVNISMYILGTIIVLLNVKNRYGPFEVLDGIAVVAFTSFIVSFALACTFTISDASSKMRTTTLYIILLIFNCLSFVFYYGFASLGGGGNWMG